MGYYLPAPRVFRVTLTSISLLCNYRSFLCTRGESCWTLPLLMDCPALTSGGHSYLWAQYATRSQVYWRCGHIGFSFMTWRSDCPTVSHMSLRPAHIMMHSATPWKLVTISVISTLSLLASFPSSSLIGTYFKTCQPYSSRAFVTVAFDLPPLGAAIKDLSTDSILRTIVGFSAIAVAVRLGSVWTIPVSSISFTTFSVEAY